MLNCPKCRLSNEDSSKFCSRCGKYLRQKDTSPRKTPTGPFENTKLREQGQVEIAEFREKLKEDAKKQNPKIFVGMALVVIVFVATLNPYLGFCGVIIAAALANGLYKPDRWLSEAEYYSFTGTKTAEGEHQCVYCGARGIYRQGEYATQNTYASCSKCKASLFHE